MGAPTAKELEQRVLILAPTGRDGPLTQQLLQRAGCRAEVCPDMACLCRELPRGVGAMVVAEEALIHPGAGCLIQALQDDPPWSDPPLIVLTGQSAADATGRLATTLGAHATLVLLERPLRPVTLVAAVQSSLRTRRRQYQTRDLLRQREQAVRERDRFLAVLSHELRNPLATIRMMLALGEQENRALPLEEQQVIARQTRHLSRLIDDLLDVSRISAGKIVLKRIVVDFNDIVRRSIESLQPAIRAMGHTVTLTPAHVPVYVLADPARLEQVVTNLVNNAVKYTPEGGRIDVSLGTEAGQAVLRVHDNGIGIPPTVLPQLFQPFMQVEQSLDRAQGGLGLGLSLVRMLVEMQQGSVTAASEGLGRGSEFTVTLPLTTPPASAQAAARPAQSVSRRVLLIEDGDDARRALGRLLRSWGHQVELAEDGRRGVEKALVVRPEIALVDLGLPGLDGYAVARRLRSELAAGIRLVALTGYGQPEDRQRTREAGFDLHLVKPVDPNLLRDILSSPDSSLPA